MEKLSDNILLYHVLPCLDFFVYCEFLELRKTCKRFKTLVHRYLKSSPWSFQLDYLNSQLSLANSLRLLFENSMNDILENINKVTHGELIDYLSQSNQNKIHNSVLKCFKPLVFFVDYKLPTVTKTKSKTEYKKKRLIPYLEFLGDFWYFKNKLLTVDIFNITKAKLKALNKLLLKHKSFNAENLHCLSACLNYISLCCEYCISPTKDLIKFHKRNEDVLIVTSSTISDRLAYLLQAL